MDFNGYVNLIGSQKNIPWILFLISFGLLAVLEALLSARKESIPRVVRWPNHLLLAIVNILVLKFLLPGFLIWAAMDAYGRQFGILNWIQVPNIIGIGLTILMLDWMLYYLHRAYHAVPFAWKVHRVHHTDPEVDVTTGLRFHPLEIFVTFLAKGLFIYLMGAPVYGVFLFEIILSFFTLYDHSNLALPKPAEKLLRFLLVTPFMHQVHHAKDLPARNKNFGFIFSTWDRLLGTYQDPAKAGSLRFGFGSFQSVKSLRFASLLAQPFIDEHGKFKWTGLWGA